MGGTQRMAAVAAVSHTRLYNHTQPEIVHAPQYSANVFFICATLCGVFVAICAICWRRAPSPLKPDEDVPSLPRVYTVSGDLNLHQVQQELHGPPPAYDQVVGEPIVQDADKVFNSLQEVITEACSHCQSATSRPDTGLPSYEAAVLLRDTKL